MAKKTGARKGAGAVGKAAKKSAGKAAGRKPAGKKPAGKKAARKPAAKLAPNVRAFLARLEKDERLRARVRAASDETLSRLVDIAREEGHDLSADDVNRAMHRKLRDWKADEDEPAFTLLSERPGR
jgi:predicted ribosomally synthesized peptide with nif11-like leader